MRAGPVIYGVDLAKPGGDKSAVVPVLYEEAGGWNVLGTVPVTDGHLKVEDIHRLVALLQERQVYDAPPISFKEWREMNRRGFLT